jgi:hypothetical protein
VTYSDGGGTYTLGLSGATACCISSAKELAAAAYTSPSIEPSSSIRIGSRQPSEEEVGGPSWDQNRTGPSSKGSGGAPSHLATRPARRHLPPRRLPLIQCPLSRRASRRSQIHHHTPPLRDDLESIAWQDQLVCGYTASRKRSKWKS